MLIFLIKNLLLRKLLNCLKLTEHYLLQKNIRKFVKNGVLLQHKLIQLLKLKHKKLNKKQLKKVLAQIFDQADADTDGKLTAEEYKAFVSKNYGEPTK